MFTKGHPYGRRFQKGQIAWNAGLKMKITKRWKIANEKRRGVSLPKPKNFCETMRKVNPPLGIKKKFDSRDKDKKIRVWRDGYVFIYKPEHPSSRKAPPDYGYILEHRLVVEKQIGRQIKKGEVVHHIDGCKSNNKKDNLLLCGTQREHNQVHTAMETFVEKLIREKEAYYDKGKKEFKFR